MKFVINYVIVCRYKNIVIKGTYSRLDFQFDPYLCNSASYQSETAPAPSDELNSFTSTTEHRQLWAAQGGASHSLLFGTEIKFEYFIAQRRDS